MCVYLYMTKRNKHLKAGRPLKYGEETVRHSGFHCPKSKKDEIDCLIKTKLKTWEIKSQ